MSARNALRLILIALGIVATITIIIVVVSFIVARFMPPDLAAYSIWIVAIATAGVTVTLAAILQIAGINLRDIFVADKTEQAKPNEIAVTLSTQSDLSSQQDRILQVVYEHYRTGTAEAIEISNVATKLNLPFQDVKDDLEILEMGDYVELPGGDVISIRPYGKQRVKYSLVDNLTSDRISVLMFIYRVGKGNIVTGVVNVSAISQSLGMKTSEVKDICRYLEKEKLIRHFDDSGERYVIEHDGLKKAERLT